MFVCFFACLCVHPQPTGLAPGLQEDVHRCTGRHSHSIVCQVLNPDPTIPLSLLPSNCSARFAPLSPPSFSRVRPASFGGRWAEFPVLLQLCCCLPLERFVVPWKTRSLVSPCCCILMPPHHAALRSHIATPPLPLLCVAVTKITPPSPHVVDGSLTQTPCWPLFVSGWCLVMR